MIEERNMYEAHPSMFRNSPVLFIVSIALIPFYFIGLVILVIWWLKVVNTTLTVTNKRIILRKGILSKHTNEVYHEDIRDVRVSQEMSQRIFGTATLSIATAAPGHTEIVVKGIPAHEKVKSLIDQYRSGCVAEDGYGVIHTSNPSGQISQLPIKTPSQGKDMKKIVACCVVFFSFLLFALIMSSRDEETGTETTTISKPPSINRSSPIAAGQPESPSEVPQQQKGDRGNRPQNQPQSPSKVPQQHRTPELREGMLLHEVQRIYGEGKRTKYVVANEIERSSYDFESSKKILKASFVDDLLKSWEWITKPEKKAAVPLFFPTAVTERPDLEVLECRSNTGKFGVRTIQGILRNNTSKKYSYVQINFNLYDSYDNQVGSTIANINNLEPNATWKFEAIILEDSARKFKRVSIEAY